MHIAYSDLGSQNLAIVTRCFFPPSPPVLVHKNVWQVRVQKILQLANIMCIVFLLCFVLLFTGALFSTGVLVVSNCKPILLLYIKISALSIQ